MRRSHHSAKSVVEIAATLSHSMKYGYWGVMSGGFWLNVNRSTLSFAPRSPAIQAAGQAEASSSSHAASLISATLSQPGRTITILSPTRIPETLMLRPRTLISTSSVATPVLLQDVVRDTITTGARRFSYYPFITPTSQLV